MWLDRDPRATRFETHFDGRVVRCFRDRPQSVWSMLEASATAAPEREALVGLEGRLSYGALVDRAAAIAGGLAAAGVEKGERVAILIGNRFAFVEAFLACQRIGAIAVPMNPRQRAPEIAYALNQCGAVGIIFDSVLAENLPNRAETPTLRSLWSVGEPVDGTEPFEALASPAPSPVADVAEEDTAALLYTSGTTGRPKGAMLTHLNIVHSALHFAWSMGCKPGDRNLLAVPASHVTGLIANIATALVSAGTIVVLEQFKARAALDLIAAERVTHTLIVPAMYNLMLRDPGFDDIDLSTWRIGGYGGAPMPQATIHEMAKRAPGVGLMNGYGATEATSPTTMLPTEFAISRADSVGLPLHCAEVLVMDDTGREVPHGTPGEIWMRGPHIVPGYWDNPDANAENFVAGFWKSGDIGAVDADGFVQVHDRKKDMLNRGGYKIYSIEVENTLSFHPHVLESAIIARPCPVLGERVHAVVVPRDATPSETLAEEMRMFCSARLSDYKVPEAIHFRSAPLPRNPNGKILKTALRQEYGG